MNFDLSEDEEMLKALAERFVVDNYTMDRRCGYLAEPEGFSSANWAMLGELGLIAAPFDIEHGGMGLDATAIATLFEAFGNGLVVEPLIENVLLAGRLFAACAPSSLRDEWMPGLLDGTRRIALAHVEQRARSGNLWVECSAEHSDSGIVVSGAKSVVPAGSGVDGYIVSARTSGAPGNADGVGLYLVAAASPGLTCEYWRLADGCVAATVTLNCVSALPLHGGTAEIATEEDFANLARSAEALGIMERIFAETLEYLRTREQFGAKLASFQAVQHRMVTQYAAIAQARALLNLAMVTNNDPEFSRAVAGARAFIARASIELGHEMIQFHGGMGVTDELSIGHAHKRLLVLSRWPDSPDAALDRFAGVAS